MKVPLCFFFVFFVFFINGKFEKLHIGFFTLCIQKVVFVRL